MKLGGGSDIYPDFDRLASECHTYASKEVVEWYRKDFLKMSRNRCDRIDARNRLLLTALAAALAKCANPTILDFGGRL